MAKILIFGAGAVGQFIGAKLIQAGSHKVTLIGRAEHFDAIRSGGLTLQLHGATESLNKLPFFTLTQNVDAREKFDWIFLTVKGYDLKKAVLELRTIIKNSPDVRFLLFQRGMDWHGQISKIIPSERLFAAALTVNLAIMTPGTVTQLNHEGALCFAPMQKGTKPDCLYPVLSGINLRAKVYKNWESMKWSALLFEMLTDSLCAMGDYTPEKLLQQQPLYDLEMRAFKEGVAVAGKYRAGICSLPGYGVNSLRFLAGLPGFIGKGMIIGNLTSERNTRVPTIKFDMEKGRRESELQFINGAISSLGAQKYVSTPVNDFITQELSRIISGKMDRGIYRKKPGEIASRFESFEREYKKGRK